MKLEAKQRLIAAEGTSEDAVESIKNCFAPFIKVKVTSVKSGATGGTSVLCEGKTHIGNYSFYIHTTLSKKGADALRIDWDKEIGICPENLDDATRLADFWTKFAKACASIRKIANTNK